MRSARSTQRMILASLLASSLVIGETARGQGCPPPGGGDAGTTGTGDSSGGTDTGGGGGGGTADGGGGGAPDTGGPGKPETTGGGKTPTPGDVGGGPTTPGPKVPTVGGGPGGGAGPGGGNPGGPTTGGGAGPRPGGGPGGGGGGSRGGAAVSGKKNRNTVSLDRWDVWWEQHRDALLAGFGVDAVETGQGGFVSGSGTFAVAPRTRRPTELVLLGEVLPALEDALKDSDARVSAAAATALGRIASQEFAGETMERLEATLRSRDAAVREAALVAVGLVGDRAAKKILWQVMNDTAEGRALLGLSESIGARERSFAALGLGLGRSEDSALHFRRLMQRAANDVEVAGCATLALGLLGPAAADHVPFLGEMLCDRSLDRRVRAQVPVALARIGQEALPILPYLLQYGRDSREDALVRQSCVIGLGRLACGYDAEILAELADLARTDRDATLRHYAFLAIAQSAARGGAAVPAASLTSHARFLAQALAKPKYKVDSPWIAIACGLLASTLPRGDGPRAELEGALQKAFRATSNPEFEGAFAIGLGLARAHAAVADLVERFENRNDDVRGHIALALGMIGQRSAIAPLRKALHDETRPETRLEIARGLGLLDSRDDSDRLLAELENGASSAEARAIAHAVARLGDPAAATRLARLVAERTKGGEIRSACCEALGLLAERTEVPFTARLTGDLNVHAGLLAPAEVIERM